jgi:hypothetical protein
MERSVDGKKLHRKKLEKYSGDFIPYNVPQFFQGSEKLEKLTWVTSCLTTTKLLPTRLQKHMCQT